METKIFKANYAGYLATSVLFLGSIILFIGSLVNFLIHLDIPSGSIWLAGVLMLALSIFLALSDLHDVHITENEIIIFSKLSKKVTRISRSSISEIDFRSQTNDGPYVDFWYESPLNGKKVRKTISLMALYPRKKFLQSLSEITTVHTFNGIKSDFKDISTGW